MQQLVKERVAKLREEIAQIREANRQYMYGGKKNPATAPDHERRLQRLKEILNELASLTEWKQL
jgi:DNA-binding MurR/RpiR family transcriptional regulator